MFFLKMFLGFLVYKIKNKKAKTTEKLNVVCDFQLMSLLGKWYQVERYDHWFQRGMHFVKTNYSLNSNGEILVENTGVINEKNNSVVKTIKGVAKFAESKEKGWLKVSFFKPFYSDYKILFMDNTLKYMLVTTDNYDYLWILTKQHDFNEQKVSLLKEKAKQFGFDVDKLKSYR